MTDKREMTIPKLFALTVAPSAVFTALYIAVGYFVQDVPPIALFCILAIATLFPFEIGVILSANKKDYGKRGIKTAFSECENVEWWKILLYAFFLFGVAGLASETIAPLENTMMSGISGSLKSILPAYFDWENFEVMKQYPKGILVFTSIIYLIFNVLVFPAIEEIYFRGYLTNELKRYGIAAPILVTIAFSFYHWWLPFNNIFRICIFTLASIVTYKKKSIYISMIFHSLCNLFSTIGFILTLLS